MPTIRELIEHFNADHRELNICFPVVYSRERSERFDRFFASWQSETEALGNSDLADEQVDINLFRRHLAKCVRQQAKWNESREDLFGLFPFLDGVFQLGDDLSRMRFVSGEGAAQALTNLSVMAKLCARDLSSTADGYDQWITRLPDVLSKSEECIQTWSRFYSGYDPLFDWWVKKPKADWDSAFSELKQKVQTLIDAESGAVTAGVPPVGREALLAELAEESVGYTPEELIQIAEDHYKMCESHMFLAAKELGFDDWRTALDHVKGSYVAPGQQPQLILDLLNEAIEFVESRQILTVPPIAKETIRMEMMSAKDQRVNPFFLGGELIMVSYPTSEMTHSEKLMSMRGNNPALSRATVQHELIPGHHMQWHAAARFKPYRQTFSTPFWIEGWTLHWEMLLWDLEFPRTPEERIGMMFWRMHRCVRVLFSLRYHLGEMTPDECVDVLVHRVGHERSNAEAEVRRSFGGLYDPLYQLAYLIGGLMVRDMYHEWVNLERSPREFHDRFLAENGINLGVLRNRIFDRDLSPSAQTSWTFAV